MRRAALGVLLAGLLLAPVACTQLTERGSGAVEEAVDDTEAETGAEASDAATDPEAETDTEAEAQDGGPSEEQIAAATGTAAALPTLSAEQVDLISNFQPPSKGSEDALITVYEFSDYL